MDRIEWLSEVTLRAAVESDLPALEWDGEYIHFRRLYRQVYESTIDGRAVIWVADLPDPGVIGQLFVQLISGRRELADGVERGYIYGFRIKPEFRRNGLGSRMLEIVEEDLRSRLFVWCTLNVSQDNPEAMGFYKRHGYNAVANEPGHWTYIDHLGNVREVHEPAFRMEKNIGR